MEEAIQKKNNVKFFACLGGCIGLTLLSIILFLARGLDSNRFFGGITWTMACLPISMVVPWYTFFDFVDHTTNPKHAANYFPLAGEEHEKAYRLGFIVSLIAAIATFICFFAFNGSQTVSEAKSCLIFLISSLPGLIVYLVPTIHALSKKNQNSQALLLLVLLAIAAVAAGLIVSGMVKEEMTYLVSYIVFPIIILVLLLYKRED